MLHIYTTFWIPELSICIPNDFSGVSMKYIIFMFQMFESEMCKIASYRCALACYYKYSFLFFSYTVSLCDTVCMVEDIIIIFSSKHKYYFLKLWLFWERMKFAVILELRNAKITAEYKRNCLHSPTYINYFNWNLVFRTS